MSTQLGCTVPFTLVHAGKCRTEDRLKTQTIEKLNTTQKNPNNVKHSKQNYPDLVAFYTTRPGNAVGWFYKAPKPTACWGITEAFFRPN